MIKALIQSFFNKLFTPHGIVIFTICLSAAAWFTPTADTYDRGFSIEEPVTWVNICFITAWYSAILIPAYWFFLIGKTTKPFASFDRFANIDSNLTYYLYSFLGLIGFIVGLKKILADGIVTLFLNLFIEFQGNAVQEALDENYSIGLISLRYILIITFGIALYRIQTKKQYSFINIANVFLFILYMILFNKRQHILTSFVVYFAISNRWQDLLKKISAKAIYISLILIIALITVSSTLRNFKTYEGKGQTNAIGATSANALEYLASPFQAQLEIGNNWYKSTHGVYYLDFTHVSEYLNTNSAMSKIIFEYGWYGFLYISVICAFLAYICGVLYQNKDNYLFIGYPVILYGFAEFWRVYYFTTGIFFLLTIISIGIPAIIVFYKKTFLQK